MTYMNNQPSTYEWLKFIKDEFKYLEEEKRFLITISIGIISAFYYLFQLFIKLLDSLIILNVESDKKIIFGFSIIMTSLYFFRLLCAIYIINFQEQINRILNMFHKVYGSIIPSFIIIINFMIMYLYKMISPYLSISIPLYILDSIAYQVLIYIWGIFTILIIVVMLMTRGSIKKLDFMKIIFKEKFTQTERIGIYFGISFFVVIEIICTVSIIWLLTNLYYLYLPIYDLLKILVGISLVIMALLFICIAWVRPLLIRLSNIYKKIKRLSQLRSSILKTDVILYTNFKKIQQYYEE